MRTIIQSMRRDHRQIEELLRVLGQECDLFRRAERPDYDLLCETVDCFRSLLNEYYYPREDFMFSLTKNRNERCARAIDNVLVERAIAALSLQALSERLRDILTEQRVSRQAFDEAARSFIQHERRQIEIEERQFFPVAFSVLTPADWADIHTREKKENESQNARHLKKRLRAQRRWIIREALADQRERSRRGESHGSPEAKIRE